MTLRLPAPTVREIHPARGVTLRLKSWRANDLRWALRVLNLTQLALARLLSVDPRTVRRWALGESRIPGPVVALLETWLRERGYS